MSRRPEQKITAAIPLETANSRKALLAILNGQAAAQDSDTLRQTLTRNGCENWTNEELLEHFEVELFHPPYVTVIRKADGRRGSIIYTDAPRVYFCFEPDTHHDVS